MKCAEAYVRFLYQWLLENCLDDMEFMADKFDKTCIERLRMVSSTHFERISYTEAVELLEDAVKWPEVGELNGGSQREERYKGYLAENTRDGASS
nr:asparagine--trna ligase, cytoplasmic 1 [Quercus suber]